MLLLVILASILSNAVTSHIGAFLLLVLLANGMSLGKKGPAGNLFCNIQIAP